MADEHLRVGLGDLDGLYDLSDIRTMVRGFLEERGLQWEGCVPDITREVVYELYTGPINARMIYSVKEGLVNHIEGPFDESLALAFLEIPSSDEGELLANAARQNLPIMPG